MLRWLNAYAEACSFTIAVATCKWHMRSVVKANPLSLLIPIAIGI